MTRLTIGLIVPFMFTAAVDMGCSGPDPSNVNSAGNNANRSANSQNPGNDSVEELRTLVQIPFEPEEVTWRISEAGGKKRLVAVLLLSSEDQRALAAKYGPAGANVQVTVERWFPVELTAMGETSGEMTIGGKAYPANDFFQAPYTAGSVVFVPETNYVVLDLQSS